MEKKEKAGRNRTIDLNETELEIYRKKLLHLSRVATEQEVENRTICQDTLEALPYLPDSFVDLCFVDPPYNLTKTFNKSSFKQRDLDEYGEWVESWVKQLPRLLKPTASIYVCCDWRSSSVVHLVLEKYFSVRNRITWEREKGRGAKKNWKNCLEDIWFCTAGNDYYFDVDSVKVKRRVIAPYTDGKGRPKDWAIEGAGKFRMTHPSNLWSDLTVPFWSMPENTDHPTQKPEKMLAKVILANSRPGDMVFDPFLGSGTTSVAARKLGRRFCGIEMDEKYACLTEKRLSMAERNPRIQGYDDGIFWQRNSMKA